MPPARRSFGVFRNVLWCSLGDDRVVVSLGGRINTACKGIWSTNKALSKPNSFAPCYPDYIFQRGRILACSPPSLTALPPSLCHRACMGPSQPATVQDGIECVNCSHFWHFQYCSSSSCPVQKELHLKLRMHVCVHCVCVLKSSAVGKSNQSGNWKENIRIIIFLKL